MQHTPGVPFLHGVGAPVDRFNMGKDMALIHHSKLGPIEELLAWYVSLQIRLLRDSIKRHVLPVVKGGRS